MFRWFRWLVLIGLIAGAGGPAHGQSQNGRRWLADPEILLPDGRAADVRNIAMVDAGMGWASAGNTLLWFDGRFWWVDRTFEAGLRIDDLAFADASHGWAGGAVLRRTTPTLTFGAYDGRAWSWTSEFRGKDGRLQATIGSISAVAALPGGQALALGSSYGQSMIFHNDGAEWRDATPDGWPQERMLKHLAMVGASEAWVGGRSTQGAGHPLLSQLKDGAWQDVDLSMFPASSYVAGLQMRGPDEGWAIINDFTPDPAAICTRSTILRYRDGAWMPVPNQPPDSRPVSAFALIPGTDQGWVSLAACGSGADSRPAERRRFDAGRLLPDPEGATLAPSAYGLLDAEHQYAVAGGNFLRWSAERLPTAPVEDSRAPGSRYFPVTGHSVEGAFLEYYASHGLDLGDAGVSERESLALFGYPISQPFPEVNPDIGRAVQVQYFERARLELHPENPPPYDVLLGRLTASALRRRAMNPPPPTGPVQPGCIRNEITQFDLCPPLRDFWERNGATPVFGHPLSQATPELSQTDGRSYATQYFERGRMEHHPEHAGSQYEVLLGLLGSEELRTRGYLPR